MVFHLFRQKLLNELSRGYNWTVMANLHPAPWTTRLAVCDAQYDRSCFKVMLFVNSLTFRSLNIVQLLIHSQNKILASTSAWL